MYTVYVSLYIYMCIYIYICMYFLCRYCLSCLLGSGGANHGWWEAISPLTHLEITELVISFGISPWYPNCWNTTIFWRIPPFFGEYLHFLERPIISFSLNRPFEEYHHFLERPAVRYFPSVRRLPIRSPWRRQMASPSRPKWQGRQVAGNDKWIIISFDQNPGWKLATGDDDDNNSYNNNNNNHHNNNDDFW